MTLIGRRDLFGIEYELDAPNGPDYLFGKLCFWFSGDRFGGPNGAVALADAQHDITRIVKDAGHRDASELWSLSARDLFEGLSGRRSSRVVMTSRAFRYKYGVGSV
jgi:hypothetical protein